MVCFVCFVAHHDKRGGRVCLRGRRGQTLPTGDNRGGAGLPSGYRLREVARGTTLTFTVAFHPWVFLVTDRSTDWSIVTL